MGIKNTLSSLLLRLALAATFLSAVASRLSLWGTASSGWKNFLIYAAEVNSFAPIRLVPILAVVATLLEITFAVLLILGYKTKWAAIGTGILTLLFALAMTYSFGIKSPFDYSVFVDSAAGFSLAVLPQHPWSLDNYLKKQTTQKLDYA